MRSVKESAQGGALELFQVPFSSPAENLACDEALLDLCENSEHPGFLRFWESASYFVVLGYGKKFESEVFREGCAELDIPILRRSSGGGTVLQGPGSLNYTLVLPISNDSELESITGANRFIMERNRNALAALTDFPITIQGCTDLTVHSQKFSGNAQRRKKRCLLFHGAFLLDFELELINRTLRLPVQQPEYRAHRSHSEFLTNLPLDRAKVRDALIAEWNGTSIVETTTSNNVLTVTNDLARSRYSSTEWNQRF